MPIRIVRLGSARLRNEGIRIGTVRHPPRGVPKTRFASDNYYDAWLPMLAPSAGLVRRAREATAPAEWLRFERAYRAEMRRPDAGHLLDLLAALSHSSRFSLGCYCEDEGRCHRSVLRALLRERGAALV